jgi:polyisoprenoid-binding protein YceI
MKKLLSVLALAIATSALQAAPTTWKIDPSHSGVTFTVRHFFTKVPGSFAKFDGTIIYDAENIAASSVNATVEIPSVNTNDAKRDGHLQNEDFFLSSKFPVATFKSKSWKKTGADAFEITGDLTIKDVTKEVVLATKLLGTGPNPRNKKTLSGWEATTKIDRRDFGITYGQPAVGNEVEIALNIEAVKQD